MEYTSSDALPAGPVVERSAGGNGALSPLEAARSLADTRYKEQAKAVEEKSDENAKIRQEMVDNALARDDAASVKESAEQADTGEATPPPGESETQETEAALPPLDAPRSWTAEDKELFKALPRETQERLVDRERSRERDFNRRQQEATEKLKGLTAKEQQVEQARERYEQSLPALLQTLQESQAGEFADIKSLQDVTQLAQADPFRFAQWQAHQMKIAAVQQQIDESSKRRAEEKSTHWQNFVKEQDALFFEKASEMTDPKKAAEMGQAAISYLQDVGFSDDELGQMWTGQKEVPLRDHRVQLLIRDGVRYRQAQAAAKKVTAEPKPPVQRPGTTATRSAPEAEIQSLTKQLDNSKGLEQIRIASRITALRRSMPAR